MEQLKGKVAVITGASEGIGRALALELASKGVRIVAGARNEARLASLVDECRAKNVDAAYVVGDLARADDCKKLVEKAVAEFGGIDLLVNNAGVTMWADFCDTADPALIARVMETNYYSCAYCTHFALPYLLQSKGRLVGVSSVAGMIGVPGHAIYGASKHAIHGLLDSLRIELRGTGVSVTVVAPDFVATKLHVRGFKADGSPMGRRLDPGSYMTAEACAKLMLRAIVHRQRILITTRRGRLAFVFRGLFPQLIDRIAARQAKKAGLH